MTMEAVWAPMAPDHRATPLGLASSRPGGDLSVGVSTASLLPRVSSFYYSSYSFYTH